jgi:hypothetical protein
VPVHNWPDLVGDRLVDKNQSDVITLYKAGECLFDGVASRLCDSQSSDAQDRPDDGGHLGFPRLLESAALDNSLASTTKKLAPFASLWPIPERRNPVTVSCIGSSHNSGIFVLLH